MGLNDAAIVAATIAAFVLSMFWYIAFDRQRLELSSAARDVASGRERPAPSKLLLELVRSLVVATVVAGLASDLHVVDLTGAIELGLALWVGFPLVLIAGSVQWENVPWRLAAIHAGDWLVKLLAITIIVGVWH